MASTFPAAIVNEPPPCMSSEDEDSEEFRSHGLKLDVPSGDPTPVSTPSKKSAKTVQESNANIKPLPESNNQNVQSGINVEVVDGFTKENDTTFNEIIFEPILVNGNEDFTVTNKTQTVVEKYPTASPQLHDSFEASAEETSASGEHDLVNEVCDNSANSLKVFEENNQFLEGPELQHVDSTSPSQERVHIKPEDSSNDHREKEVTSEQFVETNNTITSNEQIEESSNSKNTSNKELETSKSSEMGVDNVLDATNTAVELESVVVNNVIGLDNDEEEFGDFGVFQSVPSNSASFTNSLIPAPSHQHSSIHCSEDDDDDFGDFAQVPVHVQLSNVSQVSTSLAATTSPPMSFAQNSVSVAVVADNDDDDDFADFQNSSKSTSTVPHPTTSLPFLSRSNSITSPEIPGKINSIIKTLFEIDSSLPENNTNVKLKSIDSEISISNDTVWSRVQDFESSQGLTFKWLSSLTERNLLSSLNIDNSNIMYHEKWGSIEVPKFAASLVMSPLQPVSCSSISHTPPADTSLKKTGVRHITVNNNNIIEGMSCQNQDKPASISAEAQEILRQLPDLSYMRATTLVFPQTSPSGI